MFQKLLIIVSYGAFLLLLMPATFAGFISATVLFVLGAGLAIYKKANRTALFKERHYLCLAAAVVLAAYSGRVFYTQWVRSSSLQAVNFWFDNRDRRFVLDKIYRLWYNIS